MSGRKGDSLLGNTESDFKPQEMFGTNYEADIRNPRRQQEHQEFVGSVSPSVKLEFDDFQLQSQPAYGSSPIPASSSPIQPDVPLDDPNMGFGAAPTPVVTGAPQQPTEPKNYRLWNIEYYQFLFNVNTVQVAHRILRALVPFPPKFFEIIHQNPDFYGPFWTATTLVFMLAVTGNVASYLNSYRTGQAATWTFDIEALSVAAGCIYGYLIVIPLILWGVSKYYKLELQLLDILCIYGYSFFIYLPVSVLCILPFDYVRWALVAFGGLLSTCLVVLNFFKALRGHMAVGIIILIVMAVLHLAFALTCKLYFFYAADLSGQFHPNSTTNSTVSTRFVIDDSLF